MKRFINRHYSLVRPHLTFIYTWYIDLTCKQCNITKLALFVFVQKKMKKTKEKKGALETKECESPAAKKPKREKMNTSDVNGNTDTSHIKVMNLYYCQCLVTLMMSHVNTVQMLMGRRQSFTPKVDPCYASQLHKRMMRPLPTVNIVLPSDWDLCHAEKNITNNLLETLTFLLIFYGILQFWYLGHF